MSFGFRPMDKTTVRAILQWRYDPPYHVYDLCLDEAEQIAEYFLDPQIACHGMVDQGGDLVAYCTFGPDGQVPGGDYSADALDIGLGVRPDLTGQGRGHLYVSAVVDFGRCTFGPAALRVTIAEFNKRALRVWQKVGFRAVQRFTRTPDGMAFVVLVADDTLRGLE